MFYSDLAVMDSDGYLQIVGRIKDMIIRGGEYIYPLEIEQFLYKHPKIADVQVTSTCIIYVSLFGFGQCSSGIRFVMCGIVW